MTPPDIKVTDGKRRWKFLPWVAVEEVVKIREIAVDGDYPDPEGWRKVPSEEYIDAIQRHLQAIRTGELIDQKTGKLHSAHIACNALFLTEQYMGVLPGNRVQCVVTSDQPDPFPRGDIPRRQHATDR